MKEKNITNVIREQNAHTYDPTFLEQIFSKFK